MRTLFTDFKIEKRLLTALAEGGYEQATPIQENVFSLAMSGADVCGIAQTGTGKTLAYLLPLLNSWKYDKAKEPTMVVLVPTRELVIQVVETAQRLTEKMGTTIVGIYGGVNINTQRLQLQSTGADLIVATPGRFYDLAVTGGFKVRSVRKLVLDEVDEMLNLGFRAQLRNILELLPQRRQNLLFSATMIPEVETFVDEYFQDLQRVEAAPAGTPVESISQWAYEVPNFHTKINLLRLLLRDPDLSRVIVFAATKSLANDIHELLAQDDPEMVGLIHSNKEQNYRIATVRRFAEGTLRVLIATDIVARGIDISGVSHVINFDLPEESAQYIHRIGRTGRADQKGSAISFLLPKDEAAREAIEALMGFAIPVRELPDDLEISTQLTKDEIPKEFIEEAAPPKKYEGGGAFHEKKAKNKKVNTVISRKERMMKKYGKPIKRSGRKK
ncbi:DEAD/DEAH box helicase [Flaviaesturariibacter flavus]|uniref:DEAD/DEAH box helicase n=1 Tax=Flaviaesturariibacter flavus TaxID=2502780 RepID=A0A4R1BK37_9BACT|nr:DEAD/DEAH box helicase [Flaviaesturariibacter flavus]TCJ17684.1 DEAD/DEAH box helicase [Flaviaesturariibacter flavus]